MIGSSSTGDDSWMPLRVARWPASRKESSSESTVWNVPSYSVASKSITG